MPLHNFTELQIYSLGFEDILGVWYNNYRNDNLVVIKLYQANEKTLAVKDGRQPRGKTGVKEYAKNLYLQFYK